MMCNLRLTIIGCIVTLALAVAAAWASPWGPSIMLGSSQIGAAAGTVQIVQSITTHGASILGNGSDGTQKLVWPFTAVQDFRGVTGATIGAGDTIVGYMHTISEQGTTIWPRAITDNLGNSYNITPSQVWNPYVTAPGEGENIGVFHLSHIPAGVNTLTFDFTNYPYNTNHNVGWQDIGFVEYSGTRGVNAVVNPINTGAVQNNQLTIAPSAQSVVWALGATNTATDGSDLLTPGYSILVDSEQGKDGIGIWGSNQAVPAGPLTLTWSNPYWNQSTCKDGSAAGSTGCTVILAAVSLTGAPSGDTGTGTGVQSVFDTTRNTGNTWSFSNNNQTATSGGVGNWSAYTTRFRNTGTWFFRFGLVDCSTCGVGMAASSEPNSNYLGQTTSSFMITSGGDLYLGGSAIANTGVTYTKGDTIDLIVNLDTKTVREVKNFGTPTSEISIAALTTTNLSPAFDAYYTASATFNGAPTSAYGVTQWDGFAAPQTPVAVSFSPPSPVSVSDACPSTCSGTTISGINVSTSDGSPFTGTVAITTQSLSGLVNLSSTTLPSNVRAARDFTSNDDGPRTVTVQASESGVTASATLTMNVAGVVVSNCDIGPSAVVPPGATAANFNYCFLNADFTQNVPVNGVNFTNENTWLVECTGAPVGGTGITGSTTYFSIKLLSPGGYVNTNTCGHSPIVTDQGSTVLDHVLTRSDFVNLGATTSRLMWPHIDGGGIPVSGPGGPIGGPRGQGMNYWNYTEVTFRIPPSSIEQAFTQDSSIMDFYMNGNGLGFEGYNEIDFFETHIGWYNWGGVPGALRMNGAGACNVNNGVDNGCSALDVTNYHAYGLLTTWDGTFRAEQCFYVDNVLLPQGCQDWNEAALLCCGLPYDTGQRPAPGTTAEANYTFWNSAQSCYGGGNGCAPQDFHIYIKSLRLFACDTFWNDQGCVGMYTGGGWRAGENQPKDQPRSMFASLRHFIENDAKPVLVATLDSVWEYLVGTAIAAEQADPFLDGHLGGTWKCSDGTFYNKACKPNEFYDSGFSAEWWKECLPNHTDCIWSETAINGMRKTPAGEIGTRGPGWCYTNQPFTCSPDGKVPQ